MSVSSDWMVVDLRRLLFAFGGLGLLVVIVTFAALGWGAVARRVEPDIERQLAERSASAGFVIESMLQDAWTQARLLAVSPSVVAAAAQGARRAQQLGFDRLTPEQIELRIAANRSLRFRGDTDRFLRSVVDASVFGELFVTDRYGLVVATSAETSDFVQSEEEWWQAAFEGKDFLSEVERDESSGSIALSLSVPVRDASDQTVGVLKAVLDLRQIYPALERLSRGWGYVQVIDDRGLLLIDPHEKNLLTRVPNASSLTPGGLSRAQGEDGRTVVGIVRPAQFGVWSVVFWVPEEDAFALLSAARRAIVVGVGIALLISLVGVLGMGTWVSRAITRPINLVSAAADRVGGGDLRISVERLGSGEVAKLCLAVQRMVDRLRELVTSIRASTYHTQSRSQEIAGCRAAVGRDRGDDSHDRAIDGRGGPPLRDDPGDPLWHGNARHRGTGTSGRRGERDRDQRCAPRYRRSEPRTPATRTRAGRSADRALRGRDGPAPRIHGGHAPVR